MWLVIFHLKKMVTDEFGGVCILRYILNTQKNVELSGRDAGKFQK